MARLKISDEITTLKAEVAALKEENYRLKDALLIVKEQNRKERTEKELYMRMCTKLEEQLKELAGFEPHFSFCDSEPKARIQSGPKTKTVEQELPIQRDRGLMTMSLDPSMMQNQVNREMMGKYGYKKKQSADNTTAEPQEPRLATQVTEKRLKTLKELKATNNMQEQLTLKEVDQKNSGPPKSENSKRLTYFQKMRNK